MVAALLLYCDFKEQAMLASSDYLMTFHTAGWIAGHGQWDILYPQPGAGTFHGEPFDVKAHELLPFLPDYSVAEYMYMPASAFLFLPFAVLPPNLSLFAFQLLSLACLFGSALLIPAGNKMGRAFTQGLSLLTFLPTFLTLWIGQVGLVFGLFPLSCGYYLLSKKQDFPAGLVFSLLALKPQMLVPAIFLLFLKLCQKQFSLAFGMVAGLIGLAFLNYALLGQKLLLSWFDCLKLSDRIYSDPAMGVPVRLATSLPRAILLSQPEQVRLTLKPYLYAGAVLLACLGLALVFVLARKASPMSEGDKLKSALILGCLALPCVVPHLFIYDLCVLAPAGFLVFAPVAAEGETFACLRPFLLMLWLSVTAYCMLLMSCPGVVSPLVLCGIILLVYVGAMLRLYAGRLKVRS